MTTAAAPAEPSEQSPADLKRAVFFMSVSSFLVPAAGVLTQPVLARALGADGRGELVAAITPTTLAAAIAALGMPTALMFLSARNPAVTRRALAVASSLSLVAALVCSAVTALALPFLSAGDPELAQLMLVGLAFVIPTLVVGGLRSAAMGRQEWRMVAVESLINTSLRVLLFVWLWLAGWLTPLTGVLVYCGVPIVAGAVYLPMLRPVVGHHEVPSMRQVYRDMTSYGMRSWLGGMASMTMAKTDQLLMTPLAGTRDLGLFSVANTITDVPLMVANAIAGAVQGVNSAVNDALQVARTVRVTLLLTFAGSLVLGGTAAWWIPPVFGPEFREAVVPTVLLFASALMAIPGMVAGAALPAFGRPGLNSIGLALTCVVNVIAFVLLVRPFGIYGACYTSMISGAMLSVWMVAATARVTGLPMLSFVVVRWGDVLTVVSLTSVLLSKVRPRRRPRT